MLWRIILSVAVGLVWGLFFGVGSFFLTSQFLQMKPSTSLLISGLAGCIAGGKQVLEVVKLVYEIREKHRKEKEYTSLILKPSAEDILKHGSYFEREIALRIKRAEKEIVEAKGFVSDSRDL